MVLDERLTVRAAHRKLTPGAMSYGQAVDRVNRARAERGSATVPAIAGRILALLSAEVQTIEKRRGPRDVDRLGRIAQTLTTLQKLQPTGQTRQSAPLLGLLNGEEEGSSDVHRKDETSETGTTLEDLSADV